MKISIIGLGYVGCITSACLAKEGHQVVGVDINPLKIDILKEGKSPVIEEHIDDYIKETIENGMLKPVTSTENAVMETDVSFICVGTPSNKNGSINTAHIESSIKELGAILKNKNSYHVVVIRSTVLPGTTNDIIIKILEEESGKKLGEDIGLVFNPEFLREGSSVKDFYSPAFTIIGQYDSKSGEVIKELYSFLKGEVYITDIKVAEMIKYSCNNFHALKVSFANEIGSICKELGIDSHKVMEIFCKDHKLNISPAYLKPGFAYGGSCLPKDLRAIISKAINVDIEPVLLKAIGASNIEQIQRGVDMILSTKKRNVGVLGFSFKEGTDDLRESPMVDLIEKILGKGCLLKVYDKNVSMAKLFGANKKFIEQEIPHISSILTTSIKEVIEHGDIIVIGHKSDEFMPFLTSLPADKKVIDLVRLISPDMCSPAEYEGICW